jgi:conjugative transposon TraN protein
MKMNRKTLLTGILLFCITRLSYGQAPTGTAAITIIQPYPLAITHAKTTHLIFPYPIKSVDRGSRQVLAKKAQGLDNILLVKAGSLHFPETNLSVITADGQFYSFRVVYAPQPSSLSFSFAKDSANPGSSPLLPLSANEAQLEQLAAKITPKGRVPGGVKNRKYQVRLQLNGLYIRDDVIFCKLEIQNHSPIRYDTEGLHFIIRDKQQARRTATQEIALTPLLIHGDAATIPGHSRQVLVFALPKFTIPDQKYLAIQLMEKNGGRHLALKVHHRTLPKARPVLD